LCLLVPGGRSAGISQTTPGKGTNTAPPAKSAVTPSDQPKLDSSSQTNVEDTSRQSQIRHPSDCISLVIVVALVLASIITTVAVVFLALRSLKKDLELLINRTESAASDVLQELQQVQKQLGDRAELAADLNQMAPDLRRALADVKRHSASLGERLAGLAAREESTNRMIAQFERQVEESRSSKQILEASVARATENLALLSQRAQNTAASVGVLEAKARESEKVVTNLRDAAVSFKAPIERLNTVQTQLQSVVTALTRDSDNLARNAKEAGERVHDGQSLLEELSQSIPNVTDTCHLLDTKLQKYASVLNQEEQFTAQIKALVNDLSRALNEERKAAQADRAVALEERRQTDHLKREADRLKREADRLKQEADLSMKRQQDQSAALAREQQLIEGQRREVQQKAQDLQTEGRMQAQQRQALDAEAKALAASRTEVSAREAAAAKREAEAAQAVSKADRLRQLGWPKVFGQGHPLERDRLDLETRLLQGDAGVMALFGSLVRLKAVLAQPALEADTLASLLKETSEEAIKLWKPQARSATEVAQKAQQWADAFEHLLPPGWKLRVPQPGANKDNEWMTYRIDPNSPFVREVQNWCVRDGQGVLRQKARVI
jgi:chromosome segregation ATPase